MTIEDHDCKYVAVSSSSLPLLQVKKRIIIVHMAGNYHDVFAPENGTVADLCKAVQETADFNKYTLGGVEGGLEIQTIRLRLRN